jgi:predicted nucleic acid-binding protein
VAKAFLDTNILLYQLDSRDPIKQKRCREIVRTVVSNHEAVISTQILQEFYVACTMKLKIDQRQLEFPPDDN